MKTSESHSCANSARGGGSSETEVVGGGAGEDEASPTAKVWRKEKVMGLVLFLPFRVCATKTCAVGEKADGGG